MAFVPPGTCTLPGYSPPHNEFGVDRPLLVDLYETTVGDWRHYFGESGRAPGTGEDPSPDSWPACFNQLEAEELALRRGVRLPTASEWLYCAIGPRAHPYPWGSRFQTSVANTLELALQRPAAVGTFEGGRGPFGCYDQLGNVWEWVADRVPGRTDSATVPGMRGASSVLGGSFLYRAMPTFGLPGDAAVLQADFNALSLARETRASDVGARFAADAEDYFWRMAGEWGSDAQARRRLTAVGERFGPDARALLEELAAREGAPDALGWLAEGAGR